MGDYEARGEPKKILSLSNTVGRISCGLKHVTVITKDFSVMAWGSNKLNQLGSDVEESNSNKPVLVSAFSGARPFDIFSGSYHSICLSVN